MLRCDKAIAALDTVEYYNEAFKAGRQAGHEDVARELLRYDPSFAHKIAREFLAQHGLKE